MAAARGTHGAEGFPDALRRESPPAVPQQDGNRSAGPGE
jgi:hypothetical protein